MYPAPFARSANFLANVKRLSAVYLYGGTKVTDEGVAELKKVHPKCQVTGR